MVNPIGGEHMPFPPSPWRFCVCFRDGGPAWVLPPTGPRDPSPGTRGAGVSRPGSTLPTLMCLRCLFTSLESDSKRQALGNGLLTALLY